MAAKSASWLYEKRPIKKPRLGPADVYPQEVRQREDELTAVNVKQGFAGSPTIQDEYGSARNSNITSNRFGAWFSALLAKKQELSTYVDVPKRKPATGKDQLWLVTPRTQSACDSWFRDLATGSKPFSHLSKRIPLLNKREEVLAKLCEVEMPMYKAAFYIKSHYAHTQAMTESGNKSKKRQIPDPAFDWTSTLSRQIRDLFSRLHDQFKAAEQTPSLSSPSKIDSTESKHWFYFTHLARHLFEKHLLDKHEFLSSLLELFERIKTPDDPIIRLILLQLINYSEDFTEFELLSRKLAYYSCRKLSHLLGDNYTAPCDLEQAPENESEVTSSETNNQTGSKSSSESVKKSDPQIQSECIRSSSDIPEALKCPGHRGVVIGLSAIVQIITLRCKTALVWHYPINEGKIPPSLIGSPLDHLPCPPSALPMSRRAESPKSREEIRQAEEEIRLRSIAVENKWASDKVLQRSATGTSTSRSLQTLEALDRHFFDKVDPNNNLDTLYGKIFRGSFGTGSLGTGSLGTGSLGSDDDDSVSERSLSDILKQDESTVKLLCEWAVTTKRSGEHRSLYVAKLLERRQNEITCSLLERRQNEVICSNDSNLTGGETPSSMEPESPVKVGTSGTPVPNDGVPLFQSILISFLDHQAPVLDEKFPKSDNKTAFSNLVLLFGELIRCDVFSHDVYMCTLISRGYFSNSSLISRPSFSNSYPVSSSSTKDSNPSTGAISRGYFSNSYPVSASSTKDSTPSTGALGSFGQPPSSGQVTQTGPRSVEGSLPMFDPFGSSSAPKTETLSWDRPQTDMDDHLIDADIDFLVQDITAKGAAAQDQTDILLPDTSTANPGDKDEEGNLVLNSQTSEKHLATRHMLYTTHFPIPQDESTLHECNQRLVLLYGVGKARDEARHAVKKVTKEIMKLFSRKASMDISDGGKVKKSATKDGFNFESALTRFQSLPFYDQSLLTSTCASASLQMLNGVAKGESNYLPLVESIAFLFDLMEMAFNVHGMIQFIILLLKELEDIDKQILIKCPSLKSSYTSSIGLYVVGLLFRFQSCLVVSIDEVLQVFEGCTKLVKHVQNPADCSSPERCILGYLFDLYYSVHPLKTKNHEPIVSIIPILSKVKGVIYGQINPSILNLLWNSGYMMECLTNPKSKVDPNMVRQLNENPNCRYSFVCNAVKQIALARDANLINELSILCAELSARCPPLSADWIGVLKALCCSSNHTCGFMDSLTKREVADTGIHDNLAIFTSILVARRCFSLQDFVIHCALPSLLAACPQGGGDSEAEPGARLTCHLLLCLFRTSDPPLSSAPVTSTPATTLYSLTSPGPNNLYQNTSRPCYIIKHPCDRYLLAAAHTCIRVEAVIAALKAILVLGDANVDSSSSSSTNHRDLVSGSKPEVNVRDLLSHIDDDDDFGMPLSASGSRSVRQPVDSMDVAGLGEFAKMALRQICSQEWVHDKCLRDPEMLCKPDLLLDTMLTPKQARQLLEMICRPKATVPSTSDSDVFDQKSYITQILHSLDEWTLRVSWLQLNLMYAQCSSLGSSEVSNWLENVAKSTIDFFQNAIEDNSRPNQSSNSTSSRSKSKSSPTTKVTSEPVEVKEARVWLVAPLISKLPSTLQGKILRVAANVLESGNWMNPPSSSTSYSSSSKNKDRFLPKSNANSTATALLSYSPFMSLVLMCLKGQDEQRESLLKSLYSQLEQAVEQKPSEDLKVRMAIQEGLQLRLSLVGSMLDTIQKSMTLLTEWTLLFRNLVENVVVEPQLDYELFTIVIDMMTVLIHSTQTSESNSTESSSKEVEPRKHYHTLMKKLRKDFQSDRTSFGMNMLKQLIPVPSNYVEVIVCEPMGSLIDTKGNKIAGFDSIDKKQGLQVAEKQKVPSWEMIEGSKNPGPLLWSWFGAVGMERKPLKSEEIVNSLEWHSHSMRKPTSYFLQSPPLPPEEVDDPEPLPPPPPPPPATPTTLPPPTSNQPPIPPISQPIIPPIPQPISSIPIVESKMPAPIVPINPMAPINHQPLSQQGHQPMQSHQPMAQQGHQQQQQPQQQQQMSQHHHLQQQLMMQPQQPQMGPMVPSGYQMVSQPPMGQGAQGMQLEDLVPESVTRAKPGPKPKQQRKKRTPKNQQQQQQQQPVPSQTPPVRPSSAFDPSQQGGYGAPPVAIPNQGMAQPGPGNPNWNTYNPINQQNLNQMNQPGGSVNLNPMNQPGGSVNLNQMNQQNLNQMNQQNLNQMNQQGGSVNQGQVTQNQQGGGYYQGAPGQMGQPSMVGPGQMGPRQMGQGPMGPGGQMGQPPMGQPPMGQMGQGGAMAPRMMDSNGPPGKRALGSMLRARNNQQFATGQGQQMFQPRIDVRNVRPQGQMQQQQTMLPINQNVQQMYQQQQMQPSQQRQPQGYQQIHQQGGGIHQQGGGMQQIHQQGGGGGMQQIHQQGGGGGGMNYGHGDGSQMMDQSGGQQMMAPGQNYGPNQQMMRAQMQQHQLQGPGHGPHPGQQQMIGQPQQQQQYMQRGQYNPNVTMGHNPNVTMGQMGQPGQYGATSLPTQVRQGMLQRQLSQGQGQQINPHPPYQQTGGQYGQN